MAVEVSPSVVPWMTMTMTNNTIVSAPGPLTLSLEHFMGGRGGPPREKKAVDNERFYKLLNVEKTATSDQIKKAFRMIALKEHPDKGGDADKVS
jgi:hypothetical protein